MSAAAPSCGVWVVQPSSLQGIERCRVCRSLRVVSHVMQRTARGLRFPPRPWYLCRDHVADGTRGLTMFDEVVMIIGSST